MNFARGIIKHRDDLRYADAGAGAKRAAGRGNSSDSSYLNPTSLWHKSEIEVIDDDLGRSAAGAVTRGRIASLCSTVSARTRSDRRCLVERSGFGVRCC